MSLHFYISIRLLGLLLKTIFHFWQMHYLRLSGHKNTWGWRCLLEHCHEWIWFNFKHWGTNLKAILEAPTNSFWFFLWQFFPFVNPQGRKAPRWSTHKMSEHCRWVSPPTPSANGIMPSESEHWYLLEGGRKKGRLQKRAAFTVLKMYDGFMWTVLSVVHTYVPEWIKSE